LRAKFRMQAVDAVGDACASSLSSLLVLPFIDRYDGIAKLQNRARAWSSARSHAAHFYDL
jgi:hypothetical protein